MHLIEEIWIGVKCTNNNRFRRRRNRKKELTIRITCTFVVLALFVGGIATWFIYAKNNKPLVPAEYQTRIYQTTPFADDLCVTNGNEECEDFYTHNTFPGALLFDLNSGDILFAENAHERLYPASTTKMLTAYLALKYGDLNSVATVSKNAVNVPAASSIAHLKVGDQLTLEELLYALMLPSGNDSAVAIAEHISGDAESFVKLMNEEARLLGATNTHFTNPHGYHHKDHYTTAYDLYLMLNECIKDERFIKVVSSSRKTVNITQADGSIRNVTWTQTNQFINGQRTAPNKINVIGGKTGNTHNAGNCLALYCKDSTDSPYIAIIMGATSKRNLYENMEFLLFLESIRTPFLDFLFNIITHLF